MIKLDAIRKIRNNRLGRIDLFSDLNLDSITLSERYTEIEKQRKEIDEISGRDKMINVH